MNINANNKSAMSFLNGKGLNVDTRATDKLTDNAESMPLGQKNQTPSPLHIVDLSSQITPFACSVEEETESVAKPLSPSELNDGGGQSGRY